MAQVTIGLDEGSTTTARAITEAGGAKVPVAAQAFNDGSDHPTQVSATNPLPVVTAIPTGASTSALQTTGNGYLSTLATNSPALGQALAAASIPVILPSATITTLTPPAAITGFATSAKQDTGNTSLGNIDGKLPALGQALAAASIPVILPSATITTLTPPAAITGFATSAAQTTGNSSLSSIDGKLPALGQALAAASVPVVLTSAQLTTLTPTAGLTDTQLRASAVPISVATIPSHAVTNAGTFAVQSAATLNAETTKVIGVVRTADGSGNLLTSTTNALDINIKSGNPTTITATQGTGSNLKVEASNAGTFAVQSTDSVNAKTILSIKAAYTASQTAATVLTPTSGKKFVITDIVISATGAGTVYLFDHTDGATAGLTPTLSLAANGGYVSNFKGLYTATAANNLIKYTSGSGAAGSIQVYYYEV